MADVNTLLAGFFNSQAKGNQLLLNIIDQLVRQANLSEQNYQNALKELEKVKKGKNK
mgnify:CR=1 FL=1